MPCDTGQKQTNQNQSAKRVDGGIRPPTDIIYVILGPFSQAESAFTSELDTP